MEIIICEMSPKAIVSVSKKRQTVYGRPFPSFTEFPLSTWHLLNPCVYAEGHLFTGDTLFVGGIGRTDLPGGSMKRLIGSIREKILSLPDETRVWPGHDYGIKPYSTVGEERSGNPYLKPQTRPLP